MMIFGHHRYNDDEPAFPQGCELLRLHDLGRCWWPDLEPERGVYNWSLLDVHLAAAEARGIEMMYCFCYTPEWAWRTDYVPEWPESGASTPHSNYPPRLDVMEEFARALIEHVRRPDGSLKIKYWEAWNEFNALGFWCGDYDVLMEQQQMLYRVLREADPGVCLSTPTPCLNFTTVDQEIDQLLSRGFQQYAHLITLHGYLEPGTAGDAIGPTLDRVNEVMAKHGCRHPVWDTEFAFSGYENTGLIPAEEIPKWLSDSLAVRMTKGLAAAIWYMWDSPNNHGVMCDWQGTVNPTGRAWLDLYASVHPLPAVTGLVQVAPAGRGGCG